MMGKMNLSVLGHPENKIRVTCAVCGAVAYEKTWTDYWDYKRKKAQAERISCCMACNKSKTVVETSIKWQRTAKGDYQAIVANGDFLVFKWGNGLIPWRWRFRRKGEQTPERIRVAKTKEEAMKECEQHEEWKV